MSDLKVDIRHGSAIVYRDCDSTPIEIRTIEQHHGNHAEMVASIMADKIKIEIEEEIRRDAALENATNNT